MYRQNLAPDYYQNFRCSQRPQPPTHWLVSLFENVGSAFLTTLFLKVAHDVLKPTPKRRRR
jgi:hypothetical protein